MPSKISHYLLSILCIGCLIFLISHYGVQLYQVSGRSMEPTCHSGSFLLVQKFGIPEQISRFDIITIRSEALDNRMILKRVIGFVPSALQYASKNNSTYYIHNPAIFQPYVQNRQKKTGSIYSSMNCKLRLSDILFL